MDTHNSPETEEGSSAPVFNFEAHTVMLNSRYEIPIMGLGTYSLSDEECLNSVTVLLETEGGLIGDNSSELFKSSKQSCIDMLFNSCNLSLLGNLAI